MAARVVCLIILALELRGLSISLPKGKWKIFIFYTQLSNLVTAASAFFLAFFGQPGWITMLRYLSTCMLVMTFLVTTCVLVPMGGDPKILLWSGSGLYHHVLCPVISTVSYIFIENHTGRDLVWLPVVVTVAYGLIMLFMNGIGRVDGPYPFFRVRKQSVQATVLWVAVLIAVITGISFTLYMVTAG